MPNLTRGIESRQNKDSKYLFLGHVGKVNSLPYLDPLSRSLSPFADLVQYDQTVQLLSTNWPIETRLEVN